MMDTDAPIHVKWIGVRSAKEIPKNRPTIQCPYCNHKQQTRRQLDEGMQMQCSSCHKKFRVLKSTEPGFFLPDMAYGIQFNIDTGNYAMPAYILELIHSKHDIETAYNEWCKWKGLDPTLHEWDVDNIETQRTSEQK